MPDLRKQIVNKKILIYGYGISGKASFNYLKKNNNVVIYDDDKSLIPSKFKKCRFNKYKIQNNQFDLIIISPGINIKKCGLKKFLKKNKFKVVTELDIFYLDNLQNKKITITGTNGKSTTSKLLYEVLKKSKKDVRLVGNIGRPLLLETNIKKNTIFVIEASSYQIEYSKYFKTELAAILNISPDHLERHETFNKYVNAKLKLVYSQKKGDFVFVDKKNLRLLDKVKVKSRVIIVNNNSINKLRIKNDYFRNLNNINNLSFVLAITKKLKINQKKVLNVINFFKGLPYRQQIVYKKKNLQIINDSKSTSFSSTVELLKSYKNIYWLVGGQSKKGDKFILKKSYYKNIRAYIYGKNKKFFSDKLRNKINFKKFKNLRYALLGMIIDVKKDRDEEKNIIFSPCSASFDQFKNFEQRGKYFNQLLKKINFLKKIYA